MDPKNFNRNRAGKFIKAKEGYISFIPDPLPPRFEWDSSLISLLSEASNRLGMLVGLGETLPEPNLLIYPFIRKEAVLSSRIEGTLSSFSDLLLFEASKIKKEKDVEEVNNYVKSLEFGFNYLKKNPINLDFILETHKILLTNVRGDEAKPGEFRNGRVWIGPPGCSIRDATHVPPPPNEMKGNLKEFEKYLLSKQNFPLLINAALIHYQFEAIHPFFDGNGRIGRLLIVFYLHKNNLLPKSYLYLSEYFEKKRIEYYNHLLLVSQKGKWKEWINFFLQAIIHQSKKAIFTAHNLAMIQQEYRKKILEEQLSPTAGQVLELVFKRPVINIKSTSEALNVTFPAVSKAVKHLQEIGILKEVTGDKKNRVFKAQEILKILGEE